MVIITKIRGFVKPLILNFCDKLPNTGFGLRLF